MDCVSVSRSLSLALVLLVSLCVCVCFMGNTHSIERAARDIPKATEHASEQATKHSHSFLWAIAICACSARFQTGSKTEPECISFKIEEHKISDCANDSEFYIHLSIKSIEAKKTPEQKNSEKKNKTQRNRNDTQKSGEKEQKK